LNLHDILLPGCQHATNQWRLLSPVVGWLIEIQRYRLFRASERAWLAHSKNSKVIEVGVLFLSFAHSLARAHIELVLLLHLSHSLVQEVNEPTTRSRRLGLISNDRQGRLETSARCRSRTWSTAWFDCHRFERVERMAMAISTRKRRTWSWMS